MFEPESKKIKIFATGKKGLSTIQGVVEVVGVEGISQVVIGNDKKMADDGSGQIIDFCNDKNIINSAFCQNDSEGFGLALAAGWQRMIFDVPGKSLVVFHDSLLPRYRGFNPLVSALLNRETEIGVTALSAATEYDRGSIYLQKSIEMQYPITICDAIEKVSALYFLLAKEIVNQFLNEKLFPCAQDERKATYSLWRDEEDYKIDWLKSAEDVFHFINCVGYPYRGASSNVNGSQIRIAKAKVVEDVVIENRVPGKVIFMHNDCPVIVCGKGLLLLEEVCDENGAKITSFNFKTRFK